GSVRLKLRSVRVRSPQTMPRSAERVRMDGQAATSSQQFAAQLDPLLLPFVQAATEAEFEQQKAFLFENHASPRIEEIIRGKLRVVFAASITGQDAMDIV